MLNQTFLIIVLLYGVAVYFHGHQASHLTYIKIGQATLNPFLVLVLWIYHITFLPWLAMIWLGYKTIWYYPLMVIIGAQIVRAILIAYQSDMGLAQRAAYISLIGIIAIPVTLAGIVMMIPNIGEVTFRFF
jgi:hypothetical protein